MSASVRCRGPSCAAPWICCHSPAGDCAISCAAAIEENVCNIIAELRVMEQSTEFNTYRSVDIAWHYEICFYLMILEIRVPISAFAFLHLVIAIQTLESFLGDVNTAKRKEKEWVSERERERGYTLHDLWTLKGRKARRQGGKESGQHCQHVALFFGCHNHSDWVCRSHYVACGITCCSCHASCTPPSPANADAVQ